MPFNCSMDNFIPPVFPLAGWWNQHAPVFMPHFLVAAAENYFDGGFFSVGELPTEDWAGIGFGVSLLAVVSWLAALPPKTRGWRAGGGGFLDGLSPLCDGGRWISLRPTA